ncbi:ZIP family metal transporter [Mollicutes bacterium LVI A0078]|nr:ZIP family metal transporter [Mollicutes bacterium LVI A0075]WOO90862.1 ZIP family metal transporter [Mollicutes bacterium LVI A0078]
MNGLQVFITEHIYITGLVAGLFTWGLTALGASLIFFFKEVKQVVLDGMLGFAAGVMIAASFFSLIIPALDYAEDLNKLNPVLIVVAGVMAGALFLRMLDLVTPHFHPNQDLVEGTKSKMKRTTLLVMAITMHNIPEGLAVGVAFGAFAATGDPLLLGPAIALTLGIGIQNFPEGAAVSFPLYREGKTRKQSFMMGQISGLVEPIAIIIGIALVSQMEKILAFSLAFAAGAMLFVVVEELIPESQAKEEHRELVTIFTIIGLCVMLSLDVLLG